MWMSQLCHAYHEMLSTSLFDDSLAAEKDEDEKEDEAAMANIAPLSTLTNLLPRSQVLKHLFSS